MGSDKAMVRRTLEAARQTFMDNIASVSLEEALDIAGGFRSIVGLIKHASGWTEVYRSYAFDDEPTSWTEIDWPFGLRERIEPSQEYLDAVREWYENMSARWLAECDSPLDLYEHRPVHWGGTWQLGDIVASVADHWSYHAGEINALLAIQRGEAWEFGEHVEENHIATLGHSVRRDWISDEDVARYESEMRQAAEPDRVVERSHPAATTIRRYARQDRDVVVTLSLRAWEPVHESIRQVMGDEIFDLHYRPDWRTRQRNDIEAVLDDDHATVWVAEDRGAVIGWVAVILHADELMGEVQMVAVEPDHQSHGVGTELTDVATDWMREAGMTHAVVLTGGDAGHAPARRIYEKAGYRPFPGVNYFKAL